MGMTRDEKLARLKQVRVIVARVSAIRAEREFLKTLAEGLTGRAQGDKVSASSVVADVMAERVARLCDLDAELSREIDELLELRRKIREALVDLNDARHIEVLSRRYLRFETWDHIAHEMRLSRQWVLKIHERALDCLKFT